MRSSILLKTGAAALATALVFQGAGAAAGDVNVRNVMTEIRRTYATTVKMYWDVQEGNGRITLVDRDAESNSFAIAVQNGRVAEEDINALAAWIEPLHAARDASRVLRSYTERPDPGKMNSAMGKLRLTAIKFGQKLGLFRGGRQMAEVDGGVDASRGQISDATEDAIVRFLAADGQSEVTPTEALDALVDLAGDVPTDASGTSAEDEEQGRQALARRLAARVADASEDTSGETTLSVDELTRAYEAAGIPVVASVDGNDKLTLFRVDDQQQEEVIATDLQLYSDDSTGGPLRLGREARIALQEQTEGEQDLSEAATEVLDTDDEDFVEIVNSFLESDTEAPDEPEDERDDGGGRKAN